MLRRLGVTYDRENPKLERDVFLKRQFYRAGVASAPYAAARAFGWEFRGWEAFDVALAPAVWGLAATGAALAALAFARRQSRLPMATAVLFGFCWAIPMRHNTSEPVNSSESIFYLWLALALFTLAPLGARRLLGERLGKRAAIAAAALAAPIFAMSVFYAGQATEGWREAERQRAEMADFDDIREMTRGEAVAVFPFGAFGPNSTSYYLAGSYEKDVGEGPCEPDAADFLVSVYRIEIPNLLTPDNRFAFLYENLSPLELCRWKRRRLESAEPAARAAFDVYLQDGEISYMKAPCEPSDYEAPFYTYVHPVNTDDMPARFRLGGGYHSIPDPSVVFEYGGACFMTLRLPTYPIAAIQTGQWLPGEERLWEVFINPPLSAEALAFYENAYQDIASSGEPAARSGFDLYLDGETLSYLKEPCGEGDTRGRFFLSVYPADVRDLPKDRREIGHDSLNFEFAPPVGAVFNGKCMATRQLPDYDIARIETGQWIPGGERLWDGEIVVGR